MPAPPLLQLPPIHHRHPDGTPLFQGLALALAPGLHWLQGASGSGKTTLLRLLAGDVPLHAPPGAAGLHGLVQGRRLAVGSAAWCAAVAWADARSAQLDTLTPEATRQRLQQRHPGLDAAAWQHHIQGFGLAAHLPKTLQMLSTGMRRKAVLAALLASGAPVLLLDEPFAGLDNPAAAWLQHALQALDARADTAVLMVCGSWPAGLPCASRVDLDTAQAA